MFSRTENAKRKGLWVFYQEISRMSVYVLDFLYSLPFIRFSNASIIINMWLREISDLKVE